MGLAKDTGVADGQRKREIDSFDTVCWRDGRVKQHKPIGTEGGHVLCGFRGCVVCFLSMGVVYAANGSKKTVEENLCQIVHEEIYI